MSRRVKVATFDAVGGPSVLQKAGDGYFAGPTDAGIYRIARCGKHSSSSYPDWSRIRWGSEIKEEGGAIKVMVARHGDYWQISSTNSLEEIVLHAPGEAEYGDEAELRLRLESGLLLRDLEMAFGRWELVFASKTSSVSFQVFDGMKRPVPVFVRLFTPNPLPDSQVLSVKVRRVR